MTTDSTSYRIGVKFTPLNWAIFAIKKFGIYNKWIEGASVFDPTMGTGNLLAALIEMGLDRGHSIKELPVHQLFGNELNQLLHAEAVELFQREYGVDMTSNFTHNDFFQLTPNKYDILFGNPPWLNFTELPNEYKTPLKSKFLEYDLVEDTTKVLLGGARIDIAALVIQRSIAEFLAPNGQAYFFQPLSLLLNDGAHDAFRRYQVKGIPFSIEAVYDFKGVEVFPTVSTRHGLVHYQKNKQVHFPIRYCVHSEGEWREKYAQPLLSKTGPLSILDKGAQSPLSNFEPIVLNKKSKPRQGINTCGANDIFFFETFKEIDHDVCLMNDQFFLPKEFIFPLLVSENFRQASPIPEKWVLLPYAQLGRPLTEETLQSYPLLWEYLQSHQTALTARKGRMIQTWCDRGYWWALLGVGAYNFAKYKVVWQAYGRKTFEPKLFPGRWQVNQSLQAYIPLETKKEGLRVEKALKNPAIERYLHSLRMEGTMNWAQPGKISKLLRFVD